MTLHYITLDDDDEDGSDSSTSLVSLDVREERVFGGQHHAADEDAEQDDVAVVWVIAQLVTDDAKPARQPTMLDIISHTTHTPHTHTHTHV